jgi:hypothetical protein
MARRTYRVIQWATGHVGRTAIRHFVANPTFDLVGVLVTRAKKAGKDAGEIADIAPTGVITTDNVEAIVAMDADCVHFAPLVQDLDMICRLLRSGKNVVTPLGPFYPHGRYKAELEQIAAACREGGTSFHGSGIHPGFAGDLLPLTLTRLMDRIDCIHIHEVIDHLANPSNYIEFMGFGREPDDLLANPGRSPDAPLIFAQSMEMVANGLGTMIDDVTSKLELATAKKDIPHARGVVKAGTVAGQHYEWTGFANGAPLIVYHCFWTMGDEVEPQWDCGQSGYHVHIEGDPPLELSLSGPTNADGQRIYVGLPWTAMMGVNVIPAVCDAAPGVITHFDLGLVGPRGLVRRG